MKNKIRAWDTDASRSPCQQAKVPKYPQFLGVLYRSAGSLPVIILRCIPADSHAKSRLSSHITGKPDNSHSDSWTRETLTFALSLRDGNDRKNIFQSFPIQIQHEHPSIVCTGKFLHSKDWRGRELRGMHMGRFPFPSYCIPEAAVFASCSSPRMK